MPHGTPNGGVLQEYSKGRGLGDCGTRADYGWDGARFRLVHQEEMGECRGSIHYIPTSTPELLRPGRGTPGSLK